MLHKEKDESLTFDDILLIPKKSSINSRAEICVHSEIVKGEQIGIPFLSSPMITVTDEIMLNALYKEGGVPCLHRFKSFEDRKAEIKKLSIGKDIFVITIGLNDKIYEISELYYSCQSKKAILLIDVAHGHHSKVVDLIEEIKLEFGDFSFNGTESYAEECEDLPEQELFVCAGTVCTEEAALDLAKAGADAIRVNVGASPICSTRLMTGCGMPQFQAILNCSKVKSKYPHVRIWADGGMKKPGDCVKALAAGADVLMFGTPLASLKESPGEEIHKEDGIYKIHFGMASESAMKTMGKNRAAEGIETLVKVNGNLREFVEKYLGGIRSGLSYLNCKSIQELHSSHIKYTKISSAGILENKTL